MYTTANAVQIKAFAKTVRTHCSTAPVLPCRGLPTATDQPYRKLILGGVFSLGFFVVRPPHLTLHPPVAHQSII